MKMSKKRLAVVLLLSPVLSWNVVAQEYETPTNTETTVATETDKDSKDDDKKPEGDQYYDSKPEKFSYSIAGNINYNDIVQDLNNQNVRGEFDFYKFAAKSSYYVSDKWSITSKVVVEHLLHPGYNSGDVYVQDFYLKHKQSKKFAVQAGIISLPISGGKYGVYGSVMLAPVEKYLSYSWREAGLGVSGSFKDNVSYRATLTTGLDPSELYSKTGIFTARNHKFFESTRNVASAIQLVYDNKYDARFGFSALYSGLNNSGVTSESFDGSNYNFIEVFGAYKFGYFGTRAVGSYSTVSNVEAINEYFHHKVGSAQAGGLFELSYDFSRFLNDDTQKFHAVLRSEYYDTQFRTVDVTDDAKYEHYDYTLGFVYQPVDFIELKADYQIQRFGDKYSSQLFDLSFGFHF